ncbi:MAG: SDR family NAD(P)-dependent oxidoreductase, partial [Planctomycetaceae bacterium]|nr:SDR family NAD(P)-dependent oxidoreductase [Planctomycetaceae bacterium]
DMVLGHSVGQYAAACASGIMSWEDGLRLISERGRLIGELPRGGTMLAVFAPQADIERAFEELDDPSALSIAALNGTHVVVSGGESAIDLLEGRFTGRNIRCKRLTTSHAFHSTLMDPVLQPFAKYADPFEFSPPDMPLICNVTGEILPADQILDGAYWARHIREAVRYSASIDAAQESGCELILEIGPHSTLTQMATANWRSSSDRLVSCLNRNTDDATSLLQAVGSLYVHGATPDFESLFKGTSSNRVVLPTYPFQRRKFWGPDKPRAAHAEFHTAHPLLGQKMSLAGKGTEKRYESFIEPDSPPWLPDHEVMGRVVVPGAAFVEMALQAAAGSSINNIRFEQPLQPTSRTQMQTVIRQEDGEGQSIEVFSVSDSASEWTRHFSCQIDEGPLTSPEMVDVKKLEASSGRVIERDEFYRKMYEVGLNYGPEFQTVTTLRASEDGVFARLSTHGDLRGFMMPPPLLDGALHALAAGLVMEDDGQLFLPVEIESVECFRRASDEVCCHAVWRGEQDRSRIADLSLTTTDGEVIARIDGLKVQRISRDALRRMSGGTGNHLIHEMRWHNFRLPNRTAVEKTWLLIDGGGCQPLADRLSSRLNDDNHKTATVTLTDNVEFTEASAGELIIDGTSREHWSRALQDFSGTHMSAPDGIVWLLGQDLSSTGQDSTKANCEGLLHLLQELQQQGIRQLECGLLLVTTNALAVSENESCDPGQTEYWGFGRVLGAEQPGYRCRLVDLDSAELGTQDATNNLTDLLLTETRENQLALRNGEFLVPRLHKVSLPKSADLSVRIDPHASYLITGGLGMLGRQAASWLADLGARNIVLTSRRGPDEKVQAFLTRLREYGCEIVVHTADISSRCEVAGLFQRFAADLPPLKGVIHAAGLLDDALVDQQTWDRFEKVLAPKVSGSRLLDEFTRTLQLDFFVLYSSAASVLGSPGQSNYATGNAFLDGLAWKRRSAGLPATSINWGPWSKGMANDERIIKRLTAQGISPLSAPDAHSTMQQILSAGITQAIVMDADWTRLSRGLGGEAPPLLESL